MGHSAGFIRWCGAKMKLRNLGPALGFCGVCGWLFVFAVRVPAQTSVPGVADKEIVIGSCSALEGPSGSLGTQTVAGAKAYFSLVNDEGGVHDRKLRLISYDDSYDPDKTRPCFDKL